MIYNLKVFLTEEYRSIISKVIFKDKYTLDFIGEADKYVELYRESSEKALLLYERDCKGLIPSSRIEEYSETINKYIEEGGTHSGVQGLIVSYVATDIVNEYIYDKHKGTETFEVLSEKGILLCYE